MDVSGVWPFPLSLRSKLAAAGYSTLASLQNVSPSALARDIQVSQGEALRILKTLRGIDDAPTCSSTSSSLLSSAKTAWDLLCIEKTRKRISTSCAELDSLLGGGICLQEVTEICGAPGIGKTQFGMQLAINVQIPKEADGIGGSAVYIDTEGSFMVERALQMAQACVARLCSVDGLSFNSEDSFNVDTFLSKIYYFRICDSTEQIAIVNQLEKFLEEHKEVKLVVIDSVTFHFRHGFEDMALRTRLLSSMGQKLMRLSELFEVAVVLVNQVTTKFTGGISKLVPALGESWSHACTNRLILYWENNQRHAYMFKSPSLPSVSAPFSVTQEGICGVDYSKRPRRL
ncbi:hypothetical protein GOP47_0002820 [Adiantum capillus-veneris]|uniref:DNA repair protein RAD51 homolog 3 n=1 Tax=Adiantum capillus-veneris TaxID=13818 RepID=A0A9D4ZRM8_ADICA|nr:hypothetical protein GOP47_0002820 [Adiantum capillus-veneris]